jgi:hypothetical protein
VITGPSKVNDCSQVFTKLLMVKLKSAESRLDRAGALGVTSETTVAVVQEAVTKTTVPSPQESANEGV